MFLQMQGCLWIFVQQLLAGPALEPVPPLEPALLDVVPFSALMSLNCSFICMHSCVSIQTW